MGGRGVAEDAKLRTTASVMHTTAHPDDEHGGVLAWLSRGDGARVSLLTLNRGESGDNAIGPQLFDGLGLIRTEELLVAGQYYGVDRAVLHDRRRLRVLEDAWKRPSTSGAARTVLRDVVRIIRTERPLVILSRFQGNERDGHGNHQTAGLMAQQAFRRRRPRRCFPNRSPRGCGRGSRRRCTSAACARTRTGRSASTPGDSARGSAMSYWTSRASG